MKKILVAGGTGFIGQYLIKKCLKKNMLTYSLSSSSVKKKNKIKNVNYLKIDIRNKKNLYKLKKIKFDIVVNLSGSVDHNLKKKVIDTHFVGVKKLLKNLDLNYLKLFVQIGSSAEYGKIELPQKETDKCYPKSYYGKSKLETTNYLLKELKDKNFSRCILRLYQVYGPDQKENRIIPFVVKNSILNKKFKCSSGVQLRDFVYIDDVITAIFKTFLLYKKVNGQIINIGSGQGYKLKTIINKIVNYVGGGKPIYGGVKMRKDESKKVVSNIYKAKKIINWSPKIKLNKGLKITMDSFKYNNEK